MNNTRNTSSSRPTNDTHAHYKITRTVTDTNGKTHTETVEMVDDDALKVSLFNQKPCFHLYTLIQLMRDMRIRHGDTSSVNRTPANVSQSSTPAKRPAVVQDNNEFVREALQVHNELRQKHGVEPLRLNNDLSKLAQQWGKYIYSTKALIMSLIIANHLASTGGLAHSKTKYRNASVGENLHCQSWPTTG
jgi:hypothetical protein